jgi:hypothetical protein
MPTMNCSADSRRGLIAWALAAAAVIACEPRVYPEAQPGASATLEAEPDAPAAVQAEPDATVTVDGIPDATATVEAEPEAIATLKANAEPRGTTVLTVDAGGLPTSADAGPTGQDASSGGRNSSDQTTVIVVGPGGVFVNGDNNGVIVINN